MIDYCLKQIKKDLKHVLGNPDAHGDENDFHHFGTGTYSGNYFLRQFDNSYFVLKTDNHQFLSKWVIHIFGLIKIFIDITDSRLILFSLFQWHCLFVNYDPKSTIKRNEDLRVYWLTQDMMINAIFLCCIAQSITLLVRWVFNSS